MKNPLRDEASAFHVVLLVLGGAVLVVLAAWLNTWLGVAVFLVLVGAALWAVRGGLGQRPRPAHVVHDERVPRRILVVANETVGGEELISLLRGKAIDADADVLLVCPALNTKVRTWTSDVDPARAEAQARLDASLARLEQAGVRARGDIGDGDPLQALERPAAIFGDL